MSLRSTEISWGTPAPAGGSQSSYEFTGLTNTPLFTDGTEFNLGTFTHNNFPITGTVLQNATLKVNLAGDLNKAFSFFFKHVETPNNANPCAEGGSNPCPDRVTLPSLFSSETVNINGQDLALKIIGFKQGGTVKESFLTLENQANSAVLVGQLTPKPIPTPALLPGLIGLGLGVIRKRRSEQTQESEA